MATGPEHEPELSFADRCQPQNDGIILLQLLEFKTHLLEVIEELHIRRDAEERFDEQTSKLLLEKQELEWEKDSLHNEIETEKNHHAESLSKANKQFQAKIRTMEEEKSRHQVNAKQKDKDIHNLKEELKSLQLLKFNLEKKSKELEQKLVLQSRSKDSHLSQLGEVEKRFSALSRQCAVVKQVHLKLEANADEAMKLNKKLTSMTEKQQATIELLNKEVEELRNKLVKAKMPCVNHDKTADNPSIKEQTIKQLHQKLDLEYEMNRKVMDENKALQAEKQEVLKSLQFAHQLLSAQIQVTSRLELDIQTQRQQYQSLEQDHKAMQAKEKIVEEKIKQLMEEYTVSKINWYKEKAEFLDQMKKEQQELVTVKEAYEELHQKHSELSSKAIKQAKHINELKLKVKDSTVEGGSQGDRSVHETISNVQVSNTALMAISSDDPKDKEATIAIAGQSEHNDGTTSEILFTSNIPMHNNHLNFDNCLPVVRENISKNSFTMNEDVPGVILKSVSAEAAVSTVLESNNARMASSAASSKEIEVADTTAESANEHVKDNGTMIGHFAEKEKRDKHTQVNCEDAKENVAVQSENSSNFEDKEMTGTGDDAKDTTMFIIENVDKVHERVEESGSLEAEKQSKTTKTAVDINQPQPTEGTGNNTQVSHSISESALEWTSSENEKVIQAPPIEEITTQEVLPRESEANCNVQSTSPFQSPAVESTPSSACRDLKEKTETVSEESKSDELPETLNKSSLCQPQNDVAQLVGVSVQGTIKIQTQVVSPDKPGHMKDTVDNSAKVCSPVTEDVISPKSQEEIPELKISMTDSVATACETSSSESENNCENEQMSIKQGNTLDKSNFTCAQPVDQGNIEKSDSQKDFVTGLKLSKNTTKEIVSWPSESDFKTDSFKSQSSRSSECLKNPMEKESKMMNEFAAPIKTAYNSFQWGSAQRKAQTYNSLITKSCTGHSSVTLPVFIRNKQNKVPLMITRATDLLNGSSVCGTATAPAWRQPTEWKSIGEAHRDTAAPMECKVLQSDASSLDSVSFGTITISEEQKSKTISTDASGRPVSDWDPSCSQDTEDQQSSLRAQISKIEQFLSAERLRLPKKRKTENLD